MTDKFYVFGLPFSVLPQNRLRQEIISRSPTDPASSVIFANAHVIVEASRQPSLHQLLSRADFIVPDGMPVAWVLKAKGQRRAQRYSGPDFMEDVFRETMEEFGEGFVEGFGKNTVPGRHFFLGATQETLEKIKKKFKGTAAGFYSPPFTQEFSEDELKKQLKLIEESKADYIWIGLGAPKQEKYAVEMAARARRGVWLAVGAAFDFYAGNKPRAPRLLQSLGLEWAFRMATEPKRLAGRYLSTNPAFVKLAIGEVFRPKTPDRS